MKRKIIILFLVALLVASLPTIANVEVTKANFVPFGDVEILSPVNQTIYSSQFITLNFTVVYSFMPNKFVTYSIDGQTEVTITGLQYSEATNVPDPSIWETTNGTVALPELSDGNHSIRMSTHSYYLKANPGYSTAYFAINSTLQNNTPNPTKLSEPNSTSAMPTIIEVLTPNQFLQFLPYISISVVVAVILLLTFVFLHKRSRDKTNLNSNK